MVITHNMSAMNAQRQLGLNTKIKSAEKLSSGFKINRAADDAAGLSISEKMRFQIRGLDQGASNIQEGVGYCQVADGALNEIQDMLHRLTELSVQAANGTLSTDDRAAINDEIGQIKTEINRICNTTKYNEDYIFLGPETEDELPPYNMSFSGALRDIYIYNDTYSSVDGTATYGGVAYEGKRYSWDSIDPGMYDAATNTFHKGRYQLFADDGSYVTLICEDGSQPPQVAREFHAKATSDGIYINRERISWDKVTDASGNKLDKNNIKNEKYTFNYGGVSMSFTPEEGEIFADVVERMNGIMFESTYNLPTEETAVVADFSKTNLELVKNADVKNYLNGTLGWEYEIKADDNGLSLIDLATGSEVAGSSKTWADLGITNWGDQSTDIWSDKTYTYSYQQNSTTTLEFSFNLINETSKDSVIEALNGAKISAGGLVSFQDSAEVSENSDKILSAEIKRDKTNLSLAEAYELGRDFSVEGDVYGTSAVEYNPVMGSFMAEYNGGTEDVDNDGVITSKQYLNSAYQTDNIVQDVKKQIESSIDSYFRVITARYVAGAENPTDINLTSNLGASNITGGGNNTTLVDVFTFDSTDANLKITEEFTGEKSYAGVKMDFSGLGTDYELADLIGTGFNSTCETCTNHYSVQFSVPSCVDKDWSSIEIDGKTYEYIYEKGISNHTFIINLESMEANQIQNGVEFSNALVDILDAADFDFHFTQYATDTTNAEVYVFDNRSQYVDSNKNSIADDAVFAPYSYTSNTVADFELNLYDSSDANKSVSVEYEYDYSDLFSLDNLKLDVVEDMQGLYVLNATTNQYEKYDQALHAGEKRYNVTGVKFNTADQDAFIESYIRDTMFRDISDNSEMSIVGKPALVSFDGSVNPNNAMVTTFTTPQQIYPKKTTDPGDVSIKIQCSSNTIDQIMMKKQFLSVNRMGIQRVDASSVELATRSIVLAGKATEMVSTIRSTYGAYQNRLEYAYGINRNVHENTSASESRIRDTDMAETMVQFSKDSILEQVAQSMIAQANQTPQGVLSLLQ